MDRRSLNPLREAAELISKSACELYGVNRVGIWNLDGNMLHSVALYQSDLGRHVEQADIDASAYPAYLQALHSGRSLDAHNAHRDPRTCELTSSYLEPMGITSILDASIRIEGEVVGVLCLEHTGLPRLPGNRRRWAIRRVQMPGTRSSMTKAG